MPSDRLGVSEAAKPAKKGQMLLTAAGRLSRVGGKILTTSIVSFLLRFFANTLPNF